jgi:cell division inhibitor SepF
MAVYLGLVEDGDRYQDKYDSYAEYEEYEEPDRTVIPDEADMRASRDDYGRDDYGSYHTDWRTEHVPQTNVDRITTLHPRTYNEARTIGEHFREGTPVIMNLTEMVDSDAKRLVDFAAGLIFGLRGSIERVTNKVFLLSPANVEVTAEDKARIVERGFFNQS